MKVFKEIIVMNIPYMDGMGFIYIYICIPGSSKCVKFVPFHQKNLPKGRNFTYLEDPGIYLNT